MNRVAPPIPAPYLADVVQLSPELRQALKRNPSTEQKRQAGREIRSLKKLLFAARREFEERAEVLIIPEPPLEPV